MMSVSQNPGERTLFRTHLHPIAFLFPTLLAFVGIGLMIFGPAFLLNLSGQMSPRVTPNDPEMIRFLQDKGLVSPPNPIFTSICIYVGSGLLVIAALVGYSQWFNMTNASYEVRGVPISNFVQ